MIKKGFSGFTIIETMLFLAVTALLVVGILAGTGASISGQRYSDSVYSLQAYFQNQLSGITNIDNDSSLNGSQKYSCNPATAVVSLDNAAKPGQSNCVILGKLITVDASSGATKLVSRIVVGAPKATVTASSDDTTILYNDYIIRAISNTVKAGDIYDIEWGGSLSNATVSGASANSKFSILSLKSPVSGVIRTYINPNTIINENLPLNNQMVLASYLQNPVIMCINSDNMFKGERMAVKIDKGAASASSVEIFSSSALLSLPGPGLKVNCDG